MKLQNVSHVIAPLLVLLACPGATHAVDLRDGTWWLAVGVERRDGFLAGVIDCSAFEAKNHAIGTGDWEALRDETTTRYRNDPGQAKRLAVKIILDAAPRTPLKGQTGGEVYAKEHGFFDGNYWRMTSADHQLGFVEGYIDCLNLVRPKGDSFSKIPAWYRDWISQWFGTTHRDRSVVRRDREAVAIAEALKLARNAGEGGVAEPQSGERRDRK